MSDPILRLYDQVLPSYLEDWDNNLSIGKNIVKLFQSSIYRLKYPEVITAYSLLSSRISLSLPILILQGKEGTGKSTALDIICKIRDIDKPFACGQSTYSSLRNYVEAQRYSIDKGRVDYKDTCMLLLDNMHVSHLSVGEPLYNFLLTGYDRKTSKVALASPVSGTNNEFDTFCPKVISTVHSIFEDLSFIELRRRTIKIEFKKHEPLFITSVKKYDFTGLSYRIQSFWRDNDTYKRYVSLRQTTKEYAVANSSTISSKLIEKLDLMLDLLNTSRIFNVFDSLEDLFEYYSLYFEDIFKSKEVLIEHLEVYLDTCANKDLILIAPFKQFINACKSNGYIDSVISFRKIKEVFCYAFEYKETRRGLEKL